MMFQLADEDLQEDLISNDDLRSQSDEFLTAFVENLKDENIDNPRSEDFEPIIDILNAISIGRARQGFSPRETGTYVFSLKEALVNILQQEIKDPQELYVQSQ